MCVCETDIVLGSADHAAMVYLQCVLYVCVCHRSQFKLGACVCTVCVCVCATGPSSSWDVCACTVCVCVQYRVQLSTAHSKRLLHMVHQ